MNQDCICPICGNEAEFQGLDTRGNGRCYNCKICGRFELLGTRFASEETTSLSPKEKASLYYFLTQSKDRFTKNKITPSFSEGDFSNKDENIYSLKEILNIYPKNIDEQINMILINISNDIQYVGNTFTIDYSSAAGPQKLFPMFFIDLDYSTENAINQFEEKIELLQTYTLIKKPKSTNYNNVYTLSFDGWKKVQELQHEELPQAFIAMWFDSQMDEAKEQIKNAISDCGYIPQIISDKEYNGLVVPEILSEIRNSRFVVSDFTGDRGGVYFEAGYAEGMKKPVIYTCRKDNFDEYGVHFDLKQENFILWNNKEELHKRLYDRIKAVVGLNK